MSDLQAIPILLSPEIGETDTFWQRLGFSTFNFGNYLILKGFGIEIHYAQTSVPEVCNETSCYLRGGGILELHKRLFGLPELRITSLMAREWGMAEYYIHDPHGNLLKFGMSTEELPQGFDFAEFNKGKTNGFGSTLG